MNNIVAMTCGYMDAMKQLKGGTYVSPVATLSETKYNITLEDEPYYLNGCIEAVNKFKLQTK